MSRSRKSPDDAPGAGTSAGDAAATVGPSPRLTEEALRRLHGAEYAERFGRDTSLRRITRLLPLFDLAPDDSVVDLGCGDAQLAGLLAGRVGHYCGVDSSPELVERGRGRLAEQGLADAELVLGAVAELAQARPAAFDAAFALDVSEHVYDDDWLALLRDVRKLLRPGGRLHLHTPNAAFLVERMRARHVLLRPFPQHVALRDLAANRALLERAGFRVVREHVIAHYNVLRWIHPLARLPGLGGLFGARLFLIAESPGGA